MEYEGKRVGVIRIDLQQRPVFLKKNYGKLQARQMYVRRGSSTDPTRPADPDEVAQMGEASLPNHAELKVEFADVAKEDSLGSHILIKTELCQMPGADEIPDLGSYAENSPFGLCMKGLSFGRRVKADFYREHAAYLMAQGLLRPLRFMIENTGSVVAKNVRVELVLGLVVIDPIDLTCPPNPSPFFVRVIS